jgi:hypothetical protein
MTTVRQEQFIQSPVRAVFIYIPSSSGRVCVFLQEWLLSSHKYRKTKAAAEFRCNLLGQHGSGGSPALMSG